MWRDYGQITRPEGKWVRATAMLSVLGLEQKLENFTDFADAADKAFRKNLRFGLNLDLHLEDTETFGEMQVLGAAEVKGVFGSPKLHEWRLGQVWPVVAEEIYEELVRNDVPVSVELYSIHYSKEDPQVKFYLLAPPEHSHRKRMNRR